MNTTDDIRNALAALDPALIELEDESARHVGHAGAASGGGHYHLRIVSTRFQGLNAVARHRLVYTALSSFMPARIHALGIDAQTPEEYSLARSA